MVKLTKQVMLVKMSSCVDGQHFIICVHMTQQASSDQCAGGFLQSMWGAKIGIFF